MTGQAFLDMRVKHRPDRRTSASNVLVLAMAGAIILLLLVRWSDNAYIGLGLIGIALVAGAVPFLIATALPTGVFRRLTFFLGIFLVWTFALLSVAYLVFTINVVRSMNYGSWVTTSHLLALPVVALASYLVGYRSWRH